MSKKTDYKTINQVERGVYKLIAERLGITEAELSRNTDFERDLNADSLDLLS